MRAEVQLPVNVLLSSRVNHENASANRIGNVDIAVSIHRNPLRMLQGVFRERKQRSSLPVKFVNEFAARIGDVDIAEGIRRNAHGFGKLTGASAFGPKLANELESRCWHGYLSFCSGLGAPSKGREAEPD